MMKQILHIRTIVLFLLAETHLVYCTSYTESQPSSTCLKAFQTSIVAKTNEYRKKHNSSALKADSKIQTFAQNYSNYLAVMNKFEHSGKQNYGENLWYAFGYIFENNTIVCTYVDSNSSCKNAGAAAAKAWYDEVKYYNYSMPGYASSYGHFTQLVWKSTTTLGCGLSIWLKNCTAYVSCNYSPPGNVNTPSLFQANVIKP